MANYTTYHRPKTVTHDVITSEVTSGVARVTFIDKNNTDELAYTLKVINSSNKIKANFKTFYESVSGIVYVQNGSTRFISGIADVLESGDQVTVCGSFYV